MNELVVDIYVIQQQQQQQLTCIALSANTWGNNSWYLTTLIGIKNKYI